jgi:hypothetical protein
MVLVAEEFDARSIEFGRAKNQLVHFYLLIKQWPDLFWMNTKIMKRFTVRRVGSKG